jgi:hypothetical protein
MASDTQNSNGPTDDFDDEFGPEADPAADAADAQADTATEDDKRQAGEGEDRRKSLADRRTGLDRRQQTRAEAGYTGPERRAGERRDTGLERRRGPGRRRSDERKSAEEGEMDAHQFEFVMAIETYKKVNRRLYPTWTEILEVVHQLGYRKVLPRDIKLPNVPEAGLEQP